MGAPEPGNMGGMGGMGQWGGNGGGNRYAVCCMPGMNCWGSAYENTAGREGL